MNDFIPAVKHQDLIYDVGLHHGEDTDFYLRKGFRVVAFEADPDNADFCRAKFAEPVQQGRLRIVEGAILSLPAAGKEEKVSFYKNDRESRWGTVCTEWAQRNEKFDAPSSVIEVNAVDFEAALKEYGVPHYMKIDAQGCEMTCVDALRKFRERPDYVSIQSDKTSFSKIRQEIDLLSYLGYDGFQAIEQSGIPSSQTPPCPSKEGQYVAHRFEPGSSGLFGAELKERWTSKSGILRRYRMIRLGYFLVGDDGVMKKWRFPGARLLQSCAWRFVYLFTRAAVPG